MQNQKWLLVAAFAVAGATFALRDSTQKSAAQTIDAPATTVATPTAVAPRIIKPVFATEAVSEDADDPAVWIHPANAESSLIIGTNKTKAPDGALYVFGLDGKTKQVIADLDRPNNVDVEYGLKLGGRTFDIAVTTERLQKRLRVFAIDRESGKLTDIAPQGLPVFANETGEAAAPMGIALYKRPRDGAIFAIVGRKEGPRDGYLRQYSLHDDGAGKLVATQVRAFGTFSGKGEIEAIAVDDALGFVYYADEGDGIHKWHADPDAKGADRELAHFGRSGYSGDREGIGVYAQNGDKGFLVCTDQLKGGSEYHVYRREGEAANAHDHKSQLAVINGGADSTDGLEVVSMPLGARFPRGLMIAMNSKDRNFLVYDWRDVMPEK